MDKVFQDVLIQIGAYMVVVLLLFSLMNWLSSGFFIQFLKVKTSRGRKLLVKIRGMTQDYYRPAITDKGFLVFKDSNKDERRLKIPSDAIYRSAGVNMVDIDDERNSVIKKNFETVSGFDAVKYNDLFLRALYKPNIFDNKEKIMLALVIIILIGIVVLGFMLNGMSQELSQLASKGIEVV